MPLLLYSFNKLFEETVVCIFFYQVCSYQLKSPVNEWKFTNHFSMGSPSLDKQLIDDVPCFQSEIHLEKGKCVCECVSRGCDMILHNYIVGSFIFHIWKRLILNWLKLPFYTLFEFKLCFRNPALIRCFHTSFPKGIGKKKKSTGCRTWVFPHIIFSPILPISQLPVHTLLYAAGRGLKSYSG